VFVGKAESAKESFLKMKTNVLQTRNLSAEAVLSMKAIAGAKTNGIHVKGGSSQDRQWPVDFITILPEKVGNAWFELGTDPLGKVYYDGDGSANHRYGVDREAGAVFVLRPDGWIGAKFKLESEEVVEQIHGYLGGLLHA
jgi:phenol 2-monooxygenase